MQRANVCAQFALDDLERLDGLARELGITRSECLRKLVREVRVIPAQLIFDRVVNTPVEVAELELAVDK